MYVDLFLVCFLSSILVSLISCKVLDSIWSLVNLIANTLGERVGGMGSFSFWFGDWDSLTLLLFWLSIPFFSVFFTHRYCILTSLFLRLGIFFFFCDLFGDNGPVIFKELWCFIDQVVFTDPVKGRTVAGYYSVYCIRVALFRRGDCPLTLEYVYMRNFFSGRAILCLLEVWPSPSFSKGLVPIFEYY